MCVEGTGARLIYEKLLMHVGEVFTVFTRNYSDNHAILSTVEVYGKRIYLTIGNHSFSVFFGIFGYFEDSLHLHEKKPSLRLHNDVASLSFYGCSIKEIALESFRQIIRKDIDITSSDFDINSVIAEVEKRREDAGEVCDLLLDQDVLPGSGNVIKNEALYRAHIHPKRTMQYLNQDEITNVISAVRNFSMEWLEITRTGKGESGLFRVYRKKQCEKCGRPIMREKTGIKNRTSFWCSVCQK